MANVNDNPGPVPPPGAHAAPGLNEQELLANLPQGEQLRQLVVEGGLRQPAAVQALIPAPRPKDPGYVIRMEMAERNVRSQYLKLMSMGPNKQDESAAARIMLRQWSGAAASCIYDPLTGSRVDWMNELRASVWERVFPLMVMLCYNYLRMEAELQKQMQQNIHGLDLKLAGAGDMPADFAKDAVRIKTMLRARCTPCPVPTSCLTSYMEKKYSREAETLTKRALGKNTTFALELSVFKEQWETLFDALPAMHWQEDSLITARLVWEMLPEIHRKRLVVLPWVQHRATNDWARLEKMVPADAVYGWYAAILKQQGMDRCVMRAQEARGAQLETWDSEARDDSSRIVYAGQTRADRLSPAIEALVPLTVLWEESSDHIIQLLTEADNRRGDREKWIIRPAGAPCGGTGPGFSLTLAMMMYDKS